LDIANLCLDMSDNQALVVDLGPGKHMRPHPLLFPAFPLSPPTPPFPSAYDNEEVNARNIVPTSTKQLRACKKCHLVKTYEQFMQIGCENCDDSYNRSALDLDEKENSVANSTSANFSGLIAYMFDDDKASWVARCHALRMDHADARRKPGVYAMQLNADEALEEGFDDDD